MMRGGLLMLLLTGVPAQTSSRSSLDDPKSPTPDLNASVVAYASERVGSRVGNGACSDLVSAALQHSGAQLGSGRGEKNEWLWGTPLTSRSAYAPGDILQFRGATFVGRTRRIVAGQPVYERYRIRMAEHVAIIEEVRDRGRIVVILHQNAGPETIDDDERRKVRRDLLRFSDLRAGTVTGFRPTPRIASAD